MRFQPHNPTPSRPLALPARKFTEEDLRRQRHILLHGGTWEDQQAIPPRPWSAATEQLCEETRRSLELSDWHADQRRRSQRTIDFELGVL